MRSMASKVRLVWKNLPLPFHPAAEPAAEAALEARSAKGDKGFWDAHDRFYDDQEGPRERQGEGANLPIAIVKLASERRRERWYQEAKNAIANKTHKEGHIDADGDVAEDFQVQGTPNFFIDGRHLVGRSRRRTSSSRSSTRRSTKAQGLLSKGVKPSELYDALIKDGKGPPPPEMKDVPPAIPANDPARGNDKAKVVIHEWADFQCPFCGRVEPTVQEMMKDYGEKVKFVWHDLPLPMHPKAPTAAEAGREAFKQKGPKAFWEMHDRMFLPTSRSSMREDPGRVRPRR